MPILWFGHCSKKARMSHMKFGLEALLDLPVSQDAGTMGASEETCVLQRPQFRPSDSWTHFVLVAIAPTLFFMGQEEDEIIATDSQSARIPPLWKIQKLECIILMWL